MANSFSSAGINLGAAANLLITPAIAEAYGVIWVDFIGLLVAISSVIITIVVNQIDLRVE
jgi:hypothetical protein